MSGESVLIIEDDPTMLRVLTDNFRHEGYTVRTACDGEQGLREAVELKHLDIETGFAEQDVRSVFLDLPHAHRYLRQAREALADGGTLGLILPTANQVSRVLSDLDRASFGLPEVCEILLRFYKPNPQRLRPADRMVGHTGYLLFARAVTGTSDE